MHMVSDSVIEVQYMYGKDGRVMGDETYAEHDANTAMAFTIDGLAFVGVDRAPCGMWRITLSDWGHCIPVPAYAYRFATLDDVVNYVAEICELTVRRVDSWT